MADTTTVDGEGTGAITADGEGGRFGRALKSVAWVWCALFFLTFFTVLKIPDERIRAYIQAAIKQQLEPMGIQLAAQRTDLSLLFGPSYTMEDVTVTLPPPAPPVHLDKLIVSPSLLPLLTRKIGGSARLLAGDGKAVINGAFKQTGRDTLVDASFDLSKIDIGRLGLLPALANVRGSAIASGKGALSGDFEVPSTLVGDVDLELNKIVLDSQTISIVTLPKITVSDAKITLNFDKSGKMTIKTLRIGKAGNESDDLRATATGDATLGRTWNLSTLHVKANFSLSANVMKALILADSLSAPGKQADGSYTYELNGPIGAIQPMPVPK